jgi:tRNA (guanine37-N1)-methyltransferase
MRALALQVPRPEGERWRRILQERGLLRTDLVIDRDSDWVFLPLLTAPGQVPGDPEVVTHGFTTRRSDETHAYRDLLDLSRAMMELLPRSFDVVGDVVLVRLPAELETHASEVGEALLQFVPGARIVGEDRGVHGEARIRQLRTIAGTGSFRTHYRENGLEFVVDLSQAYFSPRLAREHALVAGQVRADEGVLDLCCGVGPFALTIGRSVPSAKVTAVDSNARAIDLLRENIQRLHTLQVEAVCADAAAFLDGAGAFDRVVLNLPHAGERFLPSLASHLNAQGVLHYYEVVRRGTAPARGAVLQQLLGGGANWGLVETHLVHEYSPGADLLGYTLKRNPSGAR